MATIAKFILHTAKNAMDVLNATASHLGTEFRSTSPFQPSPRDVLLVKALLLQKLRLPLEIIDVIIDWAEYWPCTTVTTNVPALAVGINRSRADKLILRSFPLGYYADGNDDRFAIPIDDYLIAQPGTHPASDSTAAQAKTDELLRRWKTKSSPRSEHPCRKIVFTIKSHDQGWAGEPAIYHKTYQRSWTWFDVGLERLEACETETDTPAISAPQTSQIPIQQLHLGLKDCSSKATEPLVCDIRTIQPPLIKTALDPSSFVFEHPVHGTETRLQSNVMAERQPKEHIVTWAYDDCISPSSAEGDALEEGGRGRATGNGEFIRSLKFGDIVTIWARARFPGWENHVEEAKIDVYWVV